MLWICAYKSTVFDFFRQFRISRRRSKSQIPKWLWTFSRMLAHQVKNIFYFFITKFKNQFVDPFIQPTLHHHHHRLHLLQLSSSKKRNRILCALWLQLFAAFASSSRSSSTSSLLPCSLTPSPTSNSLLQHLGKLPSQTQARLISPLISALETSSTPQPDLLDHSSKSQLGKVLRNSGQWGDSRQGL